MWLHVEQSTRTTLFYRHRIIRLTSRKLKLSYLSLFSFHHRCHNIHDSGIERLRVLITWNADTPISRVPEKILKILNTFGVLTWIPEFCQYPKILKILNIFGALIINTQIWGCEGMPIRSPNVLKIFKIFGYWENPGIHVNAPNVFKIFEIVGYPKVSTQTSDIMTPLLFIKFLHLIIIR